MAPFKFPEAQEPKVYAAIGEIVSYWALVEEQTFETFVKLADQPKAIAAIEFFAFRNYSDQLKLVNDLIRARVPDPTTLPYWKDLYTYTTWLNSHRNFVVHNPVLAGMLVDHSATGLGRIHPAQGPRLPLVNPYKPPRAPNSLADLIALKTACKKLHTHFLVFSSHFALGSLPKKLQQPLSDPMLEKYDPGLRKRHK